MTVETHYTVLLKNAHETELLDIITNMTQFIAISQKEQIPRNFLSVFLHIFPESLIGEDFAKQKFDKWI